MTQWQLRQCGGKSRLKHGFVNFLREFHRNPAWQIDVAFVIRDSDCSPPQPIEDQLQHILEASGFTPGFPVEFFAVPCMLESWLLSDLGAFSTVAHNEDTERGWHLQQFKLPTRILPEIKIYSCVCSPFHGPSNACGLWRGRCPR